MRRYFWVGIVSLALIAAGCTHGKSDQQVASDVQNKINADASFPDKGLSVTSANGVVTLNGTVSSDAARNAAAADAAQVEGVKTVVNNLRVASTAADQQQNQPTEVDVVPPPAPRSAPAKPSPRTSAANHQHSQPSAQNSGSSNNGDNGLRTTVPANTGADTVANSAPPPAPAPPQKVTIPSGTQLSIRLIDELNSEKAQVG